MAKRALRLAAVPRTFDELVRQVNAVLVVSRTEIEQAWVRSYHEIGRLINVHVLENRERAGYGAQVFVQLAERTGISDRTLRECAQFQRCFPISRKSAKLGWSHYVLLCQVDDVAQRRKLLAETERRGWNSVELKTRVRALNAAIDVETTVPQADSGTARRTHKPLVPVRGATGVYRVATIDGRRVVDLGFASYFDLNEEQAEEFKDGALVQLDVVGRLTLAEGAKKTDLFNYRVELIRVVDGDTLWVRIYLRPRQWVKQKLRLRGVDCPELKTPEGKVAKRFVDGLVAQTTAITINTTKPDKYDRYLADVFLAMTSDVGRVASDGDDVYLNNALLENEHATRKDEWEFGDWEPELVR